MNSELEERDEGAWPAARHIITLGRVRRAFLDSAARIWRADKVDQPLSQSESVLILVDQESTAPAQYIRTLQEVDRHLCAVGVIPVSDCFSDSSYLERLLGEDTLQIDFAGSRFRLTACAEANLPGSPPVLRRARHDDQPSVSADLETTDLLVLQGHAGAIDGGFGRWLTLCSRHLHQPDYPPLYPCFGTDRCFRQEFHGRPATSAEGLVDPATLRSPLLVLDGCGTLPVPGSLFRYQTSIARSIMASRVRAAVMTHGVTATPLSVLIVFVSMLGRQRTLGEAVREANHHSQELKGPRSIEGPAVAPWVLVGNPEARVLGLPLAEAAARAENGHLGFTLDEEDIPARTGKIVSLANVPVTEGPFDIACSDGRWALGALHRDGRAYIWVSAQETVGERSPGRVAITLTKRPQDPTSSWRRRSMCVQANRGWLDRMATIVTGRGGDEANLRALISLWDRLGDAIEHVAFAASPRRHLSIAPPLSASTGELIDRLEKLDRVTAQAVAAGVPVAGARLSRLWSPPWLSGGTARVTEPCSCGCPIVGNARRHAVLDLVRIQLECPACGPLGDVSARSSVNSHGSIEVTPTVMGVPPRRSVLLGSTVHWPVRRLDDEQVKGFACAAFFEPFRQRYVVTDVLAVPALARADLPVTIPDDWPQGLSQVVIVVVVGGEMSLLDFDVIVHAAVPVQVTYQGSPPVTSMSGPAR